MRTTEENLDEVSWLSPAELEASIIESSTDVCINCAPAREDRAHHLASFAGIGRLSIGEAVELLSAYSQAICTHLGVIALTEAPVSDFASA